MNKTNLPLNPHHFKIINPDGSIRRLHVKLNSAHTNKLKSIQSVFNKKGLYGIYELPSFPIVLNLDNDRKRITLSDTIQILMVLRATLDPQSITINTATLRDTLDNFCPSANDFLNKINRLIESKKNDPNNFSNISSNESNKNNQEIIRKMDYKKLERFITFKEEIIKELVQDLKELKQFKEEKFKL